MRLLFTCGGTGGHVSPALAIAEYAKNNYKDIEILFVGRKNGDENNAIKKRGYKIYEIDIQAPTKRISTENFKAILKLFRAIRESKRIITEWKPDAVIGTGGYVSFPIIYCAEKMKIQCYLHESNTFPGLVTRLLSKNASSVFINIDEAKKTLKRKDNVILSGNPILSDFGSLDKTDARRKIGIPKGNSFIVSFAGSGGADVFNREILRLMMSCESDNKKISILHATGRRNYTAVKEIYDRNIQNKQQYKIIPYIENMAEVLSAADLVISRSGALTCTELSSSKKCALMIPSPNVKDDHQYKNAQYFKKNDAAYLLKENEIAGNELYTKVCKILSDPIAMKKKEENIKKLFKENAAKTICEHIIK